MKRDHFYKPIALGLLATLCSACGGQSPKEEPQASEVIESGNFFVGDRAIYAHLVNNKDGSWVFRTVTESDQASDSGYLVRLNDLTAAFDTRIAECRGIGHRPATGNVMGTTPQAGIRYRYRDLPAMRRALACHRQH